MTALLIGSVFGTSALGNKPVVNTLLTFFDAGNSLQTAADVLVNAGIMDQIAGDASVNSFVNLLYRNVVGQESTPDTTAALAGLITNGTFTKSGFLAAITGLQLNQDYVNLVGLAQTGLEFL